MSVTAAKSAVQNFKAEGFYGVTAAKAAMSVIPAKAAVQKSEVIGENWTAAPRRNDTLHPSAEVLPIFVAKVVGHAPRACHPRCTTHRMRERPKGLGTVTIFGRPRRKSRLPKGSFADADRKIFRPGTDRHRREDLVGAWVLGKGVFWFLSF